MRAACSCCNYTHATLYVESGFRSIVTVFQHICLASLLNMLEAGDLSCYRRWPAAQASIRRARRALRVSGFLALVTQCSTVAR